MVRGPLSEAGEAVLRCLVVGVSVLLASLRASSDDGPAVKASHPLKTPPLCCQSHRQNSFPQPDPWLPPAQQQESWERSDA